MRRSLRDMSPGSHPSLARPGTTLPAGDSVMAPPRRRSKLEGMHPRQTPLVLFLSLAGTLGLLACGSSEQSRDSSGRAAEPAIACPPRALEEGAEAAKNSNPRSERVLVPNGPQALTLCRYFGFGTARTEAKVGKPASERLLREPTTARSLAREFDALPTVRPDLAFSCPSDEGELIYAIFLYESDPQVPVEVSLGGCRFARNGRGRVAVLSLGLQRRLEGLLRLR